jgi:hypothetical protein
LVVAAARQNVRRFWFPVLAWLFLAAGLFDIVVRGYTEFALRPRVDANVERLVRSGQIADLLPRSPRTSSNRVKLIGTDQTYSIEFDEETWAYRPDLVREEDFWFQLRDADVYAMVMSECLFASRQSLAKGVIENLRSITPDARAMREHWKQHKGKDVLCLTAGGTIEGEPVIYHGYYHTDGVHTVAAVTLTTQALFGRHEADMDAFLAGLSVIEGPLPSQRPQDPFLGHWVTADGLVHYFIGPNKMVVVHPRQQGRELAYSVVNSGDNSVTLRMVGGNVSHTRTFVVEGPGQATQIMRIGAAESKYHLTFVDEKIVPDRP